MSYCALDYSWSWLTNSTYRKGLAPFRKTAIPCIGVSLSAGSLNMASSVAIKTFNSSIERCRRTPSVNAPMCSNDVQILVMHYPWRQEGILVRLLNHLGQAGGNSQKEVPPILCKEGRVIYSARWTHQSKRQDYYCSGCTTSCAWGLTFILLWNWEYEIFSTTHRMVDRAGCESRTPC